MDTTGIIIVLLCFLGPVLPPVVGTVVGTIYDAVTARRLRERRADARLATATATRASSVVRA